LFWYPKTLHWYCKATGARPIKRSENVYMIRGVDVICPTGIIVDVSVKLPQSVGNFFFSGEPVLV
jgi:hypothetical protein